MAFQLFVILDASLFLEEDKLITAESVQTWIERFSRHEITMQQSIISCVRESNVNPS